MEEDGDAYIRVGSVIACRLGSIVYDNLAFYTKRSIYPVDYQVKRLFWDLNDPTKKW